MTLFNGALVSRWLSWSLIMVTAGCLVADPSEAYLKRLKKEGGLISPHGDMLLIVGNRSASDIYISSDSWPGFGPARPPKGFIGSSSAAIMQWHWLEKTPAETSATWKTKPETQTESKQDEKTAVQDTGGPKAGETQLYQKLKLQRLAEHNVKSLVLFELQNDGQWRVLYDEEATEDWKELEEIRRMRE